MHIFISYSHQDKQFVEQLTEQLRSAGHEVWIDHLKIKPGDNISKRIQEGIKSVDAFLAIVSANSLRSKWVLQ